MNGLAAWAARIVLPGIDALTGQLHQHLWWILHGGRGDLHAYGRNGQYLDVSPAARLVIVKFIETNRPDPVLPTPNHPEYPAAHSCTSGSLGCHRARRPLGKV